jgi:UDPglucose 6-dehydrogenase
MSDPVIGYVGMTHLGLCSSAAAAERGFRVLAFDPDEERITAITSGRLEVVEPNLPEVIGRNTSRLEFTSNPADLGSCDIVYVSSDVPTDEQGRSDLTSVRELLAAAEASAPTGATLAILSQVPPGFTRESPCAKRRLFYQVETLVFGRAVERALHPERFIVGCDDPARELPDPYRIVLERYGCPILRMGYESAELAKIAINVCLAATVSATNTLAELCERVGATWGEIAPALRLDRRIGEHAYLDPGLGIAGGNLERDLATVIRLAEEAGSDAGVVDAFVSHSRSRREWALRTLHREVLTRTPAPRLAILGLAYKPGTGSTRNSPALSLIEALQPFEKRVFDPIVSTFDDRDLRTTLAGSALDACAAAHAVVIMTPWPEFADLDPAVLARSMAGRHVVDPYGVLDRKLCQQAGLDHLTLGAPPARTSAEEKPCSTI